MISSDVLGEHTPLREALEQHGYRFTDQRRAVYDYLLSTDCHPTAETVHQSVRESLPTISLGTVYKSLETLVDCGLVMKLSHADGSSRYDGNTAHHHHARCLRCGAVLDVPADETGDLSGLLGDRPGFTTTGFRLELTGYCADCA